MISELSISKFEQSITKELYDVLSHFGICLIDDLHTNTIVSTNIFVLEESFHKHELDIESRMFNVLAASLFMKLKKGGIDFDFFSKVKVTQEIKDGKIGLIATFCTDKD